MCTVTIVPLDGGFRLVCNRDERRDRPGAWAPRIHTIGPLQSIFPIDPQGGGTWIGVNTAGIAATLLNRTAGSAPASGVRPRRSSRGAIVPRVLECASFDAAVRAARKVKPASFHPFRLVIVQTSTCGVVTSDGAAISLELLRLDRPLLFTSSSLGDHAVAQPRRTLFEQLVGDPRDVGRRLEGQRNFHRHHWPDRPDISIVMRRADARTVSRTVVEASHAFVTLDYQPLEAASSARLIAVGRAA